MKRSFRPTAQRGAISEVKTLSKKVLLRVQGGAIAGFNHALHKLADGGGEDPPTKKSTIESKSSYQTGGIVDLVDLEVTVVESVAYSSKLSSDRIKPSTWKKAGKLMNGVGKVCGVIGLYQAGKEIYENPKSPSSYIKATVEVGSFIFTKNPVVLIIKGTADLTGVSDWAYKKFN
jgi:hypothetical protein